MPLQFICKAFFIVDRVFIFHLDMRVLNDGSLNRNQLLNNVLKAFIVWHANVNFLYKYFY